MLPGQLDRVIEDFATTPREMRLELLLEYAGRVPPLPEQLSAHRDRLEKVDECQTPFFLAVEIDGTGRAHIHFDAPPEAPTVRGFAGILAVGLSDVSAADLVRVPADISSRLGLTELVSPLRLRGMAAIIARLKRLTAEQQRP